MNILRAGRIRVNLMQLRPETENTLNRTTRLLCPKITATPHTWSRTLRAESVTQIVGKILALQA